MVTDIYWISYFSPISLMHMRKSHGMVISTLKAKNNLNKLEDYGFSNIKLMTHSHTSKSKYITESLSFYSRENRLTIVAISGR